MHDRVLPRPCVHVIVLLLFGSAFDKVSDRRVPSAIANSVFQSATMPACAPPIDASVDGWQGVAQVPAHRTSGAQSQGEGRARPAAERLGLLVPRDAHAHHDRA